MENKFKKGVILGGLLAVAAAVGFVMTKDGQNLSEEVHKDLKTLVKHLKKALHNLEDVTKDSFNELAANVVEEYSKIKELAINDKKMLTIALQAKWHEMEAEYLADYKKEDAKNK